MRFKSLRTKMNIAFLVVLVLPLATTTLFSVDYFSRQIKEDALEKVSSDLELVSLLLKSRTLEARYLVQSYSQQRIWGVLAQLGLISRLNERLRTGAASEGLDQVLVVDMNGRIIAHASPDLDRKPHPIDRAFLEAPLWGGAASGLERIPEGAGEGRGSSLLSITASAPLYASNQGELLGAIVIRRFLRSEFLQAELPMSLVPDVFIYSGETLAACNSDASTRKRFASLKPETAHRLLVKNEAFRDIAFEPGSFLAAYQPLTGVDGEPVGALMVATSADNYVQTRTKAWMVLFGIAAVWLLLTLLIKSFLQRNLLVPIKELTLATKRLAAGSNAMRLPVKSLDEMGQLSLSFNQMAKELDHHNREREAAHRRLQQEVAERERTDEALRRSQSQLKAILDNIPDMAWLKDKENRYLAVNEAFTAVSGMKAEDIAGKTDFDIWSHSLAEKYRADDTEVIRARRRLQTEEPIVDFNGRINWHETIKTPILDETGEVVGTAGIARDITARRASEKALQTAHQQLQDIIEFLPDATFVIDQHKRVIAWNRAMEELTGVGKEAVLGRGDYAYAMPFYGVSQPILIDMVMGDVSEPAAGYCYLEQHDKTLYAEVFSQLAWDGRGAYLWAKASPLFDKEGNLIGAIESIRDITDRKRTEEALVESERRLKMLSAQLLTAQEEERKRLAREVHDSIASSLAAINISLGNAISHMGAGMPMAESLQTAVSITQAALEECRRIMTDLRPSILDDLGILATIDWLCRRYESICKGIYIDKEIDLEEEDTPETLKVAMFRVLQEAFNNIAKHSGAEWVSLSISRRDGRIEMVIEDDGVGFEVHSPAFDVTRGKGLGIESMKERMANSGGTFEIRSTPGEGTIIHCSWPRTG